MKINDVYEVMNHVVRQALGSEAPTIVDNTGLVALGDTIISSAQTSGNDVIFKTLIDRIGKTVISNRAYKSSWSFLIRSEFEFGAILQKVYIEPLEASKSGAWDIVDGQSVDPYVVTLPKVHQTLFSTVNAWEIPVTITERQIKSAFSTAESLGAFIDAIYTAFDSSVEKYIEEMSRLAFANLIGEKLHQQTEGARGVHAINLLAVYNAETGSTLTATNAWTNAHFLRWCTALFKDYKRMFAELTTVFNTEGYAHQTAGDVFNFTVLSKFGENVNTYMGSDVYHNEFVQLPSYHEVSYWQNIGSTGSVSDRAKIHLTTSSGASVEQSGVVAVMYDTRAIGVTVYNRRTRSVFNERGEYLNVFAKGEKGGYNDLTENALVFYIADSEA